MFVLKVELCDACANKLAAIMGRLGEEAMGIEAGSILQSCPECASKLPPTEGKLFTDLASKARPGVRIPTYVAPTCRR